MGIFDSVFGAGNNKKKPTTNTSNFNWIALTDLAQIDEIKEESKLNTVIIYKHSTRCGISKMVIKQFESLFTDDYKNIKTYYLDLLNYRDISNKLADVFDVVHQSPQILVVKNESCIFNTSHEAITDINLNLFK